MYLRAGKTKKFSVFHVENGKIQSILWFYVCFNVFTNYTKWGLFCCIPPRSEDVLQSEGFNPGPHFVIAVILIPMAK